MSRIAEWHEAIAKGCDETAEKMGFPGYERNAEQARETAAMHRSFAAAVREAEAALAMVRERYEADYKIARIEAEPFVACGNALARLRSGGTE